MKNSLQSKSFVAQRGHTQARQPVHLGRTLNHISGFSRVAITTLIAGGVVLGVSGCASDANAEKPATTQSAETPAPTDTAAAQAEREALIQKLEVPAGLSTEQLAKVIEEDRITGWINAGKTPDMNALMDKGNLSPQELFSQIAAENQLTYGVALLGDNYSANPDLSKLSGLFAKMNEDILNNYFVASPSQPADNALALREWSKVSDITESTGTDASTRILSMDVQLYSNCDVNESSCSDSDTLYTSPLHHLVIGVKEEAGHAHLVSYTVS